MPGKFFLEKVSIIEKSLIGLILSVSLLYCVFPDEKLIFVYSRFIFLALLLIFYFIITRQWLMRVVLILLVLSFLYTVGGRTINRVVDLFIPYTGYLVLGAVIVFKCFKETTAQKGFPLNNFILGAVLLASPILQGLPGNFFGIGICLLIATVMYSTNLWYGFNRGERNALKFILVSSFASVFGLIFEHIKI